MKQQKIFLKKIISISPLRSFERAWDEAKKYMSYYIVNKQPVFLSYARHKDLEHIISKDKNSLWEISSKITGHKENKEKQKLMFNTLNKKYLDNPDKFKSEWIEFDLKGKEASENVWDLLYNYCHFYGHAFLSDSRDFSEKLIADYEGELYSYPMGKVFAINHFIKFVKWWWKFTHKVNRKTTRVIIDSMKVNCLKGNLKEFEVYFDNYKLLCDKNRKILRSAIVSSE